MTVEEAYERCRLIARSEARNFYYGFVMLPNERRAGIYAAYAFSRRADDSVDGDGAPGDKLAAVTARRRELDAVYSREVPGDDPVLVALEDAVHRFKIPRVHLDDLLDGVEMDLTQHRYPDWTALEGYCARVAGAVGLVSLHIFGFANPAAPGYANDLGIALQIVNIMRDVGEDAARDRIYLAQEDMDAHGVEEEDVLAGEMTPGFRELMASYAARARRHYSSGERLLPLLDRRARMCVAMLAGLYREILHDIEERDYDVFTGRIALSTPRKLALMGQTTLSSLTSR
jgi:phytoene synthase